VQTVCFLGGPWREKGCGGWPGPSALKLVLWDFLLGIMHQELVFPKPQCWGKLGWPHQALLRDGWRRSSLQACASCHCPLRLLLRQHCGHWLGFKIVFVFPSYGSLQISS
jgi:hypothetical protein